ncbi:putative repeat protein (TIGR02543 family), partial [Peptoniphilus koenoeneniae]
MKKKKLVRPVAMAMAVSLAFGSIPYNVMANEPTSRIEQPAANNMAPWQPMRGGVPADAISSATYYTKANWENKIKDKSRWKVEDSQTLVRVTTSDPIQMNDIDYDGMFIDANGRYVIRLVYKEKTQAASVVWHKALINFGDLEKFVDFDLSRVVGRDGTTQYKLENVNGIVGRSFDLPSAVGGRANQRKNLPINLVLKEGVNLDTLGQENFIVQMRLTTDDYSKVYAYAPGKSSMDYSTYTKTTGVSIADKVNSLFLKGGLQADSNNATNQEFFMSEFIANPKNYSDTSNLGIIRTQYMGQTNTIVRNTVGEEPIAFTQVFDANLVNYLKADSKGNVGYVNVMTVARELSPYTKNVGIPKDKINYSADGKLAYIVIGTSDFSKGDVKVVQVPQHDQYTMLSGFYITAIDYVVDKGQFENTFSSDKVRKLNYSMMSGWTNPNNKGWTVFEKKYANDYVVPEGESYLIDTTSKPAGDQIMIHIGGDQAISRKQQGYYNGFVTGKDAVDSITKFAEGVYKFTLREGATIKAGQSLKIYMPYDSTFTGPVNFLETHNGSKLNEGAATLTLQNDRNINMHLYTDLPRGASFKLKYTLKDATEQKELVFTTPKVGTLWQYTDSDKVLTGVPNRSILNSGGNFWINTKKLEPGKDIIVEAYDNNGNKIDSKTSWFKYVNIDKIENTNKIAWTDHSDKSAILSINKSLYVPYQVLFTNDYAEGTDDFYRDPRAFTGTNDDFKKDTKEIVGYTKYDGGKVRTLYEEGRVGKLYAKVEADENEYDKDGNLAGSDVRKDVTIKKADIFDAQFNEEEKTYKVYEYKVDLTKMLPYHSDDKTETKLELKKDMKFVSTASDGSSLPSDLYETRVRARVLFDTTDGQFADNTKKAVKIVPDNVKFYGEKGYTANGFEGDNVEANTGDKFPDAPKSGTKTFLGWVTEEGKKALGNAVVTTAQFNALSKDKVFTATTPVTKHLVVYAIYTNDKVVTFDANGGKFTDGKDEMTKQSSDLANVEKPSRDGYKFLGWAATKDATKADADILKNVTDSKTVYAVWEKTAEKLTLNDPTPVEVKDLKSLTSDEKDKVKDAVIKANPTLTKDEITVADDGTVTVKTKDGKTGTLAHEKTVKQKEVANEFNPPKEPVPVENKNSLTDDEKTKVKQAVKDANPDRNFTDDDITVENDGTVKINQGGKTGTIPADKTVVQKDTILNLQAPDKTEVKDTANLTQEEREKVAAAVKEKNSLADGDKIEVDSKGNVTVTTADGKKTGKLEGKDTVKPFDRAGKTLNDPEKTPVGNLAKLTDAEKQAVKYAVKAANKDLDFKDDEIQVADDGTVTVPMGTAGDQTITADKTVKQATDDDKMIPLKAPEKTEVADKTNLTQDEKDKVKEAVIKANPSIATGYDIQVANDGSVTVTQGEGANQKLGQLSKDDTVYEKIKAPKAPVPVINPSSLTDDEKEAVKKAVKDANPNLPKDATVTVGNDGTVTVTDKDGKEIGKLTPAQTVKKAEDTTAPGAPKVEAKDDGSVTVTPPTDEDTKTVTVKYKDNDGNDKTVTATKGDDGTWTVPDGSDATVDPTTGVITIPADKVKDGTEVSAKATDKTGNTSTE